MRSARHLHTHRCQLLEDAEMERNADGFSGGSTGGYGNTGDVTGSAGYGAGTSGSGSSTVGSSGSSTGENASGMADRARDLAGNAKDKLADVGSSVRQGAGSAKDKLADALESGADKLRQRRGQMSGATGSSDVAISGDGSMNQVTDRLAGGMQATADWLRDADLDGLRTGVERQVKDHPGRTLLIAVGVGYLLGKAFRK
jgi:ElaB/YqjD/DUF883 family membrane-anchored ribosome-binding protein